MSELGRLVQEVCVAMGARASEMGNGHVVLVPLEDASTQPVALTAERDAEGELLVVCTATVEAPPVDELEPGLLLTLMARNMDLVLARIAWNESSEALLLLAKAQIDGLSAEGLLDLVWEVAMEADQLAEELEED